jgi:hypothetical protein
MTFPNRTYSPPGATRGIENTHAAPWPGTLKILALVAALFMLSGCNLLQNGTSSGNNSNSPGSPPSTPPSSPPPSPPSPGSLTPSGPIVISGQSGKVIQGLHITSQSGDCVQITNSTSITITNSEIGPCAGNAVHIVGGDQISVYDSYIHPETLSPVCCDHNEGVYAVGTSNLSIQGNVIAYSETNIEVQDSSVINVIGNLLLNPRGDQDGSHSRGNNFQCWNQSAGGPGCTNVTVANNYALSSLDTTTYLYPEAVQDSISFGESTGFIAQQNYITGGHSQYGCGLIADLGGNSVQFLNNSLVDTGQCGVAIADGTNQMVDGNHVINRTPVTGSGNQAMYVWQSYGSSGNCANVTVQNSIATEYQPNGTQVGFWQGSGCTPVTLTNNIFGAAADTYLTPVSQMLPPPLIPPVPKNCVVLSPYSTQTSVAACVP